MNQTPLGCRDISICLYIKQCRGAPRSRHHLSKGATRAPQRNQQQQGHQEGFPPSGSVTFQVETIIKSHIYWSSEPNCLDWNHYSLAPLTSSTSCKKNSSTNMAATLKPEYSRQSCVLDV
ncbi:unnamed protein product [Lepidochelys kempii]